MLDFTTPGYAAQQAQGSLQNASGSSIPQRIKDPLDCNIKDPLKCIIPMQTIASSGPNVNIETSYPGHSYGLPTFNQTRGSSFNDVPLNANYGFVQDPHTGINQVVARELQKLKDMISSIPGVVRPIPKIPDGSHRISRFAPHICDSEIPKRFQTPNMKLNDGTTDQEEHVAQHRERMEINPIPDKLKEAYSCKDFGSTLTGSTLKWLLSLPPYLITSFSHLVNLFDS